MFRILSTKGQQKKIVPPQKIQYNPEIKKLYSHIGHLHNPSKTLHASNIPTKPSVNSTVNYFANQFNFSTKKDDKTFNVFDKFKALINHNSLNFFNDKNPNNLQTLNIDNKNPNTLLSLNIESMMKPSKKQKTISDLKNVFSHSDDIHKEIQSFKHEILHALQINGASTEQIQQLLGKIELELTKQNLQSNVFSRTQVELLTKLVENLCYLTSEIVISRGTSTHDIQKLETISKEEMEKLIQKMDEAANSRLTSFAAYATILSLIVAIIIFAYQEQQSQEKEKETRAAAAEKLRIKSEAIQKKIDKIELTYKSLIDKKNTLEKAIERLHNKKHRIKSLRAERWFFTSDLDLYLIEIKKEMSHKKEKLELTNEDINKWELYVLKKRTLEDSEFESLQSKDENNPPETDDNAISRLRL